MELTRLNDFKNGQSVFLNILSGEYIAYNVLDSQTKWSKQTEDYVFFNVFTKDNKEVCVLKLYCKFGKFQVLCWMQFENNYYISFPMTTKIYKSLKKKNRENLANIFSNTTEKYLRYSF